MAAHLDQARLDLTVHAVRYARDGSATALQPDELDVAAHSDALLLVDLPDPASAEVDGVLDRLGIPASPPTPSGRRSHPPLAVSAGWLRLTAETARYDDDAEEVAVGQITLWSRADAVVAVRSGWASADVDPHAALSRHPAAARKGGLAVVAVVLGKVVDRYLPAVEGVDTDIDELEEQVFSPGRGSAAERIYRLKREVLGFHRAAATLTGLLERLLEDEQSSLDDELRAHLTAVADHLARISQRIVAQRELLTSILEAHLAQLSVRQNDDMRRISAWVAIAAVPTAVAAIYGMNFRHMPELGWRFGYPTVLLVMVAACVALYRAFRRSGWL